MNSKRLKVILIGMLIGAILWSLAVVFRDKMTPQFKYVATGVLKDAK